MLKVMADITSLKRETNTRTTQEEQLANVLETVRRLSDLATAAPKNLRVVREIFDHVNTRQYLNFETIQPFSLNSENCRLRPAEWSPSETPPRRSNCTADQWAASM